MEEGPWPRDIWLEAMWDSENPKLKPAERQLARVYARYAGNGTVTWCTDKELMRRTGIRSRDTIDKTRKTLIAEGWLVEVEPPRHHRSGRYKLKNPESDKELRRP